MQVKDVSYKIISFVFSFFTELSDITDNNLLLTSCIRHVEHKQVSCTGHTKIQHSPHTSELRPELSRVNLSSCNKPTVFRTSQSYWVLTGHLGGCPGEDRTFIPGTQVTSLQLQQKIQLPLFGYSGMRPNLRQQFCSGVLNNCDNCFSLFPCSAFIC